MAKSGKTLNSVAEDLHQAEIEAGRELVEDTVSLCEYVSRKMGIELTIEEGSDVLGLLVAKKQTDFVPPITEPNAEK